MKKIFCIIFIYCFTSCISNHRDLPGSVIPPLSLLLIDSTTRIKTEQIDEGNPIVFIYFSPDCIHCKAETKEIISKITSLSKIRFYMVSGMPMKDIKSFYKQLNLEYYKNIKVALDENLLFFKHFEPKKVPYLAIYNEHKRLVRVHEGSMQTDSIIQSIDIRL